jgi:uncharacterized protein YaiL (DUF2058 family)
MDSQSEEDRIKKRRYYQMNVCRENIQEKGKSIKCKLKGLSHENLIELVLKLNDQNIALKKDIAMRNQSLFEKSALISKLESRNMKAAKEYTQLTKENNVLKERLLSKKKVESQPSKPSNISLESMLKTFDKMKGNIGFNIFMDNNQFKKIEVSKHAIERLHERSLIHVSSSFFMTLQNSIKESVVIDNRRMNIRTLLSHQVKNSIFLWDQKRNIIYVLTPHHPGSSDYSIITTAYSSSSASWLPAAVKNKEGEYKTFQEFFE